MNHQTSANHLVLIIALSGIIPFLFSSCGAIKQLETSLKSSIEELEAPIVGGLEKGISNGIHDAKLDSLVRSATNLAMTELRLHLDTVLVEVPDSLYVTLDSLLNGIVTPFTAAWFGRVNDGVQGIKDNITDDQFAAYLDDQLNPRLKNLASALTQGLKDPKVNQDLNVFRAAFQLELDTLLMTGMKSIGEGIDASLMSRVDTVLAKIERAGEGTKDDITSVFWIGGAILAALALLFFLIRAHILKLKYRKMVEVMTLEIDGIGTQSEYDRLVGGISAKMKDQGLEKLLRKAVLEEKGLVNQPEWQDKDAQLLKILLEEKKKSAQENGFMDKLRQQGLEAHFYGK